MVLRRTDHRKIAMTNNIPPTSPAAERMRRHRQRRRDGLRCLIIELRETEIDALVQKGILKPEMRNDLEAIIDALYVHLEKTLEQTSLRETYIRSFRNTGN
jgi:hypothetical protein